MTARAENVNNGQHMGLAERSSVPGGPFRPIRLFSRLKASSSAIAAIRARTSAVQVFRLERVTRSPNPRRRAFAARLVASRCAPRRALRRAAAAACAGFLTHQTQGERRAALAFYPDRPVDQTAGDASTRRQDRPHAFAIEPAALFQPARITSPRRLRSGSPCGPVEIGRSARRSPATTGIRSTSRRLADRSVQSGQSAPAEDQTRCEAPQLVLLPGASPFFGTVVASMIRMIRPRLAFGAAAAST